MSELPSGEGAGKPSVHAREASVGVNLDTGVGPRLASLIRGHYSVSLIGILVFAWTVLWNWQLLGILAPSAFAVLLGLFVATILRPKHGDARVNLTHRTITFEGITEGSLLRAGFLEALVPVLSHIWKRGLPEPDARFDTATGRKIPFKQGEKEKILEEQKAIEAKLAQAVVETEAETAGSGPGESIDS
ncbi:MAG: hypothetical protein HY597_00010 [Candidatus Omnitrophica bacterium]|nr:hypothetical protein [Candidatus Omnitrophota bacterium]